MGNIKLLDKDTINKIAAGEVVERPVSIVKELIENSIDAGATMISCEIKDGGRSFIRITDNGIGFAAEDIEIAFLRHSTSKIKDENDLDKIKSLGFRGEALSSISAVSKVELLTKTKDDFFGHRYVCEGGEKKILEDAGTPNGTTFIIRDLFYNTPARRKFLKSAMTEAGYISDTINRLSESHPNISFRFINQGKTILFTNGNNNYKDTLYSIYGREVASNLIAVNYESDEVNISGYIGKPVIMRGNRIHENYYINGRYSKAVIITKAIEEAYKGYGMQHKYPFTSLHFEFPLEKLDVNVHPTKMEVRILDGDFYYNTIYNIIHNALKSSNLIVDASFDNKKAGPVVSQAKTEELNKKPFPFETNRINSSVNAAFSRPIEAFKGDEQYKKLDKSPVNSDQTETVATNVSRNDSQGDKVNITAEIQANTKTDTQADTYNTKQTNYQGTVKADDKTYAQINTQTYIKEESSANRYTVNTPVNEFLTNEKLASNHLRSYADANIGDAANKSNYSFSNSSAGSLGNTSASFDKVSEDINKQYSFEQLSFDAKDKFMQDKEAVQFKLVGQVFNTYWIIELDGSIFFIDQHAAHEKVIYERTMKHYREKETMSQQIFPAAIVTLSLIEIEVLKRYKEYITKLGFEVEEFGGREYSISAVPTELFGQRPEDFFTSLLDNLLDSPVKGDMDFIVDKIASMSCKAAIKGNMNISSQVATELIKELLQLENPYHCPHGRPVIITMTEKELEKKFKRIL